MSPHPPVDPSVSRRRGGVFAVSLICLAPVALNAAALWRGAIPNFMDTVMYFYPMRVHAAHLLAQGEMPFWNRTLFAGAPFLANPQLGLLYPGNWPFYLVPGPRTFTLINVLHIALLGLGMFAWVRRSANGKWVGALAAGLIAEMGGWTWSHLAFGSYLQAAAWAPWMLFAFESLRRTGRLRWAVAAGVAAAMQWLSGAPQLALYCQAGTLLYALVVWLADRRSFSFRSLAVFALIQEVIGLGLSAPQWLPSRAFLAECERTDALTLDRVASGALGLGGIVRAWFGGTGLPEDAEQILYPGVLTLALALAAVILLCRRKKDGELPEPGRASTLAAFVAIVAACLLSWKMLAPVWYRLLPFYSQFHDPRRILFLGYLFAIFAAGMGFESIRGLWAGRGRSAILAPLSAALIALVVLEPLVFSHLRIDAKTIRASDFTLESPPESTGIAPGERFFAQDIGMQYSYNYTREGLSETLLPNLGELYGLEEVQGYDPFIPWRYALYMRRLNAAPEPSITLYPSHFGLVRNPDSPWLPRFGPMKVRGPVDFQWPVFQPRWLRPGESFRIDLVRPYPLQDGGVAGLQAYVADARSGETPGNARLELRLLARGKPVDGPVTLTPPSKTNEAKDKTQLWPDVLPPGNAGIEPVRRALVLDIRSVIAPPDASIRADQAEVANTGECPMLLYSLGLPRKIEAFRPAKPAGTFESTWDRAFPSEVELHPVGDLRDAARRGLYERQARSFSPARTHIEIDPEDASASNVPKRTIEGWEWKEKRANRFSVELPAGNGGGWLVLGEPWSPGWRCRVDGTETAIRPADTLFRAVAVPPGAREVAMWYRPPGFANGLLVAALTVLLILFGGMRAKRPAAGIKSEEKEVS